MNFIYNLLRIRNIPATEKEIKLQQLQQKDTINADQYQNQIIIVKEEIKQRIISPKKSIKKNVNKYEQVE